MVVEMGKSRESYKILLRYFFKAIRKDIDNKGKFEVIEYIQYKLKITNRQARKIFDYFLKWGWIEITYYKLTNNKTVIVPMVRVKMRN